jgi:hypothetical protein
MTHLDVLKKKRKKERRREEGKINSGVQSKNSITVSVMSPNFTRQ